MDHSLSLDVDAFWISPYALSSFVALEEKGLTFTTREVHLEKNEQLASDFQHKSLTGRVPVLRHGEYTLSESQAIGEYIAETFPAPDYPRLFPADLKERGRARQLMAWIRSDLMPIREERATHTMFYVRANKPLSDAGRTAMDRVVRVAEALVGDGRRNLFKEWCLADTDFGFFLMRLVLNGDPVPAKVRGYAEAQWHRPSMQKWIDRQRIPYVAY
ncbi:MAG: glutathione transferase [Deltaproteobacteria bacterium]|nr:glutathione transferase [Deltaproteobacteria bacterium]